MAVVLVTGMSGTGKSTVLAELARTGHAVVDTDYGDFIESALLPGQEEPERLWRERIALDVAAVEPLLRERATLEIDTRRPVPAVVEAVLAVANSAATNARPVALPPADSRSGEWT